ncbi:centromere-associated protein K-domain-containing protein [Gamsiella multidivaricata]|uniref:centromere-associated protein K-domain-containing protein n=1 Tax=Gamsiella multidivaricata TaxID=101098 RepID=UPI0022204DD6|nr:centromere-associated protein K-domain-containing protein [Gamsiella multidivaricata]KAI7830408.1 centromere-associated protein K-domain-containing protein [Gamsiella multidivaricata]
MSTIDPPKRRLQDDENLVNGQPTTNEIHGQNEIALSAAQDGDLTNSPSAQLSVQPAPMELDPAYVRKREHALRTTGEILHQRCVKKMERLQQLKQKYAQRNPRPFIDAELMQDKSLAILRLEEARLQAEYEKIQANQNVFPEVIPELSKIQVRQMVRDSIRDYGIMISQLRKELEETKTELASERQLLKELKEINQALQARRKDLANLVESGMSQESSQDRQRMLETRVQVQELMRELTRFLSKHYPPIQPDDDNPNVFQLKDILEDIMNLSVSQPADPYLVLVHGEYYPPHIEQLINAGIAVRHSRDSQKLRLIDFYS